MKGVTGQILTFIISIVLALIGLALIWVFMSKSTGAISEGIHKFFEDFKCRIFCKEILGFSIGMCSGC